MNMKPKEFSVPGLKEVRKDYGKETLLEEDCNEDPFALFERWLTEAMEVDSFHANAMTLSTVSPSGMPDARTVLLRNISYGGFTFFTNYKSAKAKQIESNSNACLLFFWKELERQVKIQGEIRFLPPEESDLYFQSRPFENKVGAWASQQSQVVADRQTVDTLYDHELEKFADKNVPRPANWGGYVLIPSLFEFWQGRKSRLHDRIILRKSPENKWIMERLMP